MTIPSIHFRQPPRRISLQRSGPVHGGLNKNRPSNPALISFDLSSSDESSSDDLPMIQSNLKNQMQEIPLESDSDEAALIDVDQNSNDSFNDNSKKQVNWASKNQKPQDLVSNKSKNVYSSSPTNTDSIQSQSSPQEQQHPPHPSEDQVNNPSDSGQVPQRRRRRVRKVKIQQNQEQQQINNRNDNNVPDNEKEVEVIRNRSNHTQRTQNHFSNPENIPVNSQNTPQLSHTNPQIKTNVTTKVVDISNLPPNSFHRQRSSTFNAKDMRNKENNDHPDGLETFIVVKETKRSRKNNADFRIMKNENVVYFARVSKDEIGIYYIISKTLPIVSNSPDIVGYLRKQNHGKRYTVYGISEKLYDDRDAEALGMAFVKNPDFKSKQKTFRVSYKKDGRFNYPISKRRELSRIAEDLQTNFDGIEILFNKPPTIGPDGNPISNFGSMFVVDSSKNYVINDENDQTIFMIFKSSEASFTIKARFPFNSLMAFGLSIAIIEDCH